MTRKHPHLPEFTKSPNGERKKAEPKHRRRHGLFTNVRPSPAAARKAEQRKHLYMHASARRAALSSAGA
jgi:hypothetical protein